MPSYCVAHTNPLKAFPRIITSMDYLRLPDILQQFLQAWGAGADGDGDRAYALMGSSDGKLFSIASTT
jgi:hypothetical protein